jgi:hypothetical protein
MIGRIRRPAGEPEEERLGDEPPADADAAVESGPEAEDAPSRDPARAGAGARRPRAARGGGRAVPPRSPRTRPT